jgi:putative ABC transport system permease protein
MKIIIVVLDIVSEAWWELKRARLRSYLAALGIVLGVICCTMLICTWHLENALQDRQEDKPIDVAIPARSDIETQVFHRKQQIKRRYFLPSDGEAIARECQSVKQVEITGIVNKVDYRGKKWLQSYLIGTNVLSASANFKELSETRGGLVWGRFFNPADMANKNRVVVINQSMLHKLWPMEMLSQQTTAPPNRFLRINGIPFEIVGVIGIGNAGNTEVVFAPYTTVQDIFLIIRWGIHISAKESLRETAIKEINALLRRRIGDPGGSFITEYGRGGLLATSGSSEQSSKIYTFFGIIGVLILFSSGMAISNKAYIDALERIQQFAIRRALGATRARIYAIVLTEGAMLCGFGCFYGALIGWMIFATFTVMRWADRSVSTVLPIEALAALFGFVIAIGIVGSLQGAALAADANPAEILARKDSI